MLLKGRQYDACVGYLGTQFFPTRVNDKGQKIGDVSDGEKRR